MMKATVKKMYRVFDELHAHRKDAEFVLRGWEHKEKIYEVYAVGYPEQLEGNVVLDLNPLYLAPTMESALEEMEEMNNF